MGSGISVELDMKSPLDHNSNEFKGTLIFVCKKKRRLDRAARVTLQFRVTIVLIKGDKKEENLQQIWKVGGDIVEKGTVLNPGMNRFDFCFPLDGKLKEEIPKASYWAKRFRQRFTFLKYEHVIRAGSPPQTKDVVQYPKLLPFGDDGIREYGHEGADDIGLLQDASEALVSVLGL